MDLLKKYRFKQVISVGDGNFDLLRFFYLFHYRNKVKNRVEQDRYDKYGVYHAKRELSLYLKVLGDFHYQELDSVVVGDWNLKILFFWKRYLNCQELFLKDEEGNLKLKQGDDGEEINYLKYFLEEDDFGFVSLPFGVPNQDVFTKFAVNVSQSNRDRNQALDLKGYNILRNMWCFKHTGELFANKLLKVDYGYAYRISKKAGYKRYLHNPRFIFKHIGRSSGLVKKSDALFYQPEPFGSLRHVYMTVLYKVMVSLNQSYLPCDISRFYELFWRKNVNIGYSFVHIFKVLQNFNRLLEPGKDFFGKHELAKIFYKFIPVFNKLVPLNSLLTYGKFFYYRNLLLFFSSVYKVKYSLDSTIGNKVDLYSLWLKSHSLKHFKKGFNTINNYNGYDFRVLLRLSVNKLGTLLPVMFKNPDMKAVLNIKESMNTSHQGINLRRSMKVSRMKRRGLSLVLTHRFLKYQNKNGLARKLRNLDVAEQRIRKRIQKSKLLSRIEFRDYIITQVGHLMDQGSNSFFKYRAQANDFNSRQAWKKQKSNRVFLNEHMLYGFYFNRFKSKASLIKLKGNLSSFSSKYGLVTKADGVKRSTAKNKYKKGVTMNNKNNKNNKHNKNNKNNKNNKHNKNNNNNNSNKNNFNKSKNFKNKTNFKGKNKNFKGSKGFTKGKPFSKKGPSVTVRHVVKYKKGVGKVFLKELDFSNDFYINDTPLTLETKTNRYYRDIYGKVKPLFSLSPGRNIYYKKRLQYKDDIVKKERTRHVIDSLVRNVMPYLGKDELKGFKGFSKEILKSKALLSKIKAKRKWLLENHGFKSLLEGTRRNLRDFTKGAYNLDGAPLINKEKLVNYKESSLRVIDGYYSEKVLTRPVLNNFVVKYQSKYRSDFLAYRDIRLISGIASRLAVRQKMFSFMNSKSLENIFYMRPSFERNKLYNYIYRLIRNRVYGVLKMRIIKRMGRINNKRSLKRLLNMLVYNYFLTFVNKVGILGRQNVKTNGIIFDKAPLDMKELKTLKYFKQFSGTTFANREIVMRRPLKRFTNKKVNRRSTKFTLFKKLKGFGLGSMDTGYISRKINLRSDQKRGSFVASILANQGVMQDNRILLNNITLNAHRTKRLSISVDGLEQFVKYNFIITNLLPDNKAVFENYIYYLMKVRSYLGNTGFSNFSGVIGKFNLVRIGYKDFNQENLSNFNLIFKMMGYYRDRLYKDITLSTSSNEDLAGLRYNNSSELGLKINDFDTEVFALRQKYFNLWLQESKRDLALNYLGMYLNNKLGKVLLKRS